MAEAFPIAVSCNERYVPGALEPLAGVMALTGAAGNAMIMQIRY